jgi:hypothetical protein
VQSYGIDLSSSTEFNGSRISDKFALPSREFVYLRIKTMVKKKSEIMPVVILILISIILSGCSKNPEPDVAKTGNINQAQTATNNNNVPANNNVAANPQNTATPIVNNTSSPIVNKDKKPSPPVKEPVPQIGSGGGDMFLFTQARGALSSDTELLNAVIVEIKEGNATLSGNVSSEAQKTKAGQLIKSVNGIKSVKNNLRVSS